MASKNRVCLGCGDSFHVCRSCDVPDWGYTYCTEKCWTGSARAKACVALGARLRTVLSKEEVFLLQSGIWDTECYLAKIDEGLSREQE
jgi:hypothetical protein